MFNRVHRAVIVVFCCMPLAFANPNVVNVKGTQTILKPEYQQLGLAHGCLWYKRVCENLYRIAYEKDKMAKVFEAGSITLSAQEQEALVRTPVDDLVQELFHLNEDMINFIPAISPKKLGSYLTPEVIGQLVGFLYQLQQKQIGVEDVLKGVMPKEWHSLGELRAELEALEMAQKKVDAKLKGEIKNKERKALIQEKTQRNNAIQALKKRINALPAAYAVATFSKMLVDAHQLCQQEASVYLPETVYALLLAAVWGRANTRAELLAYYKGLASRLGNNVFMPHFEPSTWAQDVFTFEQAHSAQLAVSVHMPFEELVLATFAQQDVMNIVPPLIRYTTAHYKGQSFSDCGEVMLLNIFRLLSWDSLNRTFDLTVFERMKEGRSEAVVQKIDAIINFFTLLKSYDPAVDAGILHDRWAAIVSELPGVVYKDGVRNITGQGSPEKGFKNIENAIQALTGCKGLRALAKYAKQPLVFVISELNKRSEWILPLHYRGTRFDGVKVLVEGNVYFAGNHFELDFEKKMLKMSPVSLHTGVDNFGSLACIASLLCASGNTDISIWQAVVDQRLRRFCSLVGSWRNEEEQEFVFKLLDRQDPWKKLVFLAASRLVPDDLAAQDNFFHTVPADELSLFLTIVEKDSAKAGLAIAMIHNHLHGQFKTSIDDMMQTIQDDGVKGGLIQSILQEDEAVYQNLIQSMSRMVLSMRDENSKCEVLCSIIERGRHHAFKDLIGTVLLSHQSSSIKGKLIITILQWQVHSDFVDLINQLLPEIQDEKEQATVIKTILESPVYSEFASGINATLPNIQNNDFKATLVITMLDNGLHQTFASSITSVLSGLKSDTKGDKAKYQIIITILREGVYKEFATAIDSALATMHDENMVAKLRSKIIAVRKFSK